MRRKGFSFTCPCLVSNGEDKAFQRLLKTAETDPDKIHNSFPQIAYSDNFNEACTTRSYTYGTYQQLIRVNTRIR
jgi:hypothetical protein